MKPANVLLGLPPIAGNVRVGISQNSIEYGACSASIAAGSCTLSSLKPGVNSVVAEFQPAVNTTYAGSVSNTLALDVNRISSVPYVVTPLPEAFIGGTVTYTLRVNQAPNPSSIGAPTGTANISARSATQSLSVCQNVITLVPTANGYSQGTCTMSFNSAGNWDLSAEYSGDSNYQKISPFLLGLQQKINRFPTVVSSPVGVKKNNSSLVDFSYSVKKDDLISAASITGSVTVYAVSDLIFGGQTFTCSGPVTKNTSTIWIGSCPISLNPGSYTVFAIYVGDANFETSRSDNSTFVMP